MKRFVSILMIFVCACVTMTGNAQAELIIHFDMEDTASPLVDQIAAKSAVETGTGHAYQLQGSASNAVGLTDNGSWQLDTTDSSELNTLTNDFTVAVWVYLDSSITKSGTNSNNHRIIGDDQAWDSDAWSFGIRDGRLLFTKNGIIDALGSQTIEQNRWLHVAAVISGSTGIEFYIDGAYSETVSNTANINAGDDVFGIGRSYGDGQAQWFPGRIDELRVYNTVLDEAAIAELAFSNVTLPVSVVAPEDAVNNVPIDAEPTLEWNSGTDPEILQHVLYFSIDENWVNTALPTDSGTIVLDVAFETYQHPESLAYDTTYYWRVDEASGDLSNPSNIETGPVWQFTTASEPVPPCAGYLYDGDIDGDCFVDMNDLMLLAADWLLSGTDLAADIDNSNKVDFSDFSYIGRDWFSYVNANGINLLIVSAHPDDEGIFGGGLLPYYAQVKNIQVTLLNMVTRNANGHDPLMSGGTSRIQELRNAVDVYAGMPIGSGTVNGLGHYVTGNITFVEAGLIDTGCCGANPNDSWSDDGDGYGWGLSSGVTLVSPGYGNKLSMDDGRAAASWIIAREIRRFQPEVVVTVHDLEGDYGHSNHVASAIGLIEAYELAADAGTDIDGIAPWLAQKLYLRGGPYDNRSSISWDNFTSDGGINALFHGYMEQESINGQSPRTVADQGLNQHVSQGSPDVSTVFRSNENFNGHHSEWWTLYRSTVGSDALSTFTIDGDTTGSTYTDWGFGDFLENLGQ